MLDRKSDLQNVERKKQACRDWERDREREGFMTSLSIINGREGVLTSFIRYVL